MTQLDRGSVETYHCFEVPKKRKVKKPIIFYAFGYMENQAKGHKDNGASTSH